MIEVRAATEDDVPRILKIVQESISPAWTHAALLSEIFRVDSFFLIAVEDKKISGFVILRQMADEGELLQIAVDKTTRRRGIAGQLMDVVLSRATECAIKSVFLEVRKSNEAAMCLYKKHGFEFVRYRKDYYSSPLEDAVVMVRGAFE